MADEKNRIIHLSVVLSMTDNTLKAVLKALYETALPGAPDVDLAAVSFQKYVMNNPTVLEELGLHEATPEAVRPMVWRVMKEMLDSLAEQQRENGRQPHDCLYCDDLQPHFAYERHFRWPR